jgi:DNA mismatch endonuclease, patch repair protein
MADVFDRAKRSQVMSRIRGQGNKATELALISLFRAYGIKGWRRHQKIFGRPDFIFPKKKVAVFVDGCFWHGCPKHSNMPVNDRVFWNKKLFGNKKRDQLVSRTLRSKGWRVLRVLEHEFSLRHKTRLIRRLSQALAINITVTLID